MAKRMKQAKCPAASEWTKVVHPYRGILFSLKKEQSHAKMGRKLENTTLRERSQTQKSHNVCDSMCVKCPEQACPQRQEVGVWLSGAGDAWEVTADGDGLSSWGDGMFQN